MEYELTYKPLSANTVLTEMGYDFGAKEMGHRWIINNSSEKIDWGIEFQEQLLKSRINALKGLDNVIIDRTPIDNLVYSMYECLHNVDEKWVEALRKKAFEFYLTFDLIIFIPYSKEQGKIEDNGSRIPNIYFQELISTIFESQVRIIHDMLFDEVMESTHNVPAPKFIKITQWDFEQRLRSCKTAIDKL